MNKAVIAVIAVVVVVLIVVLVTRHGGGTAGGGTGPIVNPAPPTATPQTLSDEELKRMATSVPKSSWNSFPPNVRKQVEDYVAKHPELGGGVSQTMSQAQIENMYKSMPKDQWKTLPDAVQKQLQDYAKTQEGK
jgi:hypothetical protein